MADTDAPEVVVTAGAAATESAAAAAAPADTASAADAAPADAAKPKKRGGKKETESFLKNIVASAMDLVGGDVTAADGPSAGSADADAADQQQRTIYLPSLKRFCDMAAERAIPLGLALSYDSEHKRVRVGLPGPMLAPEGQPHPWIDALPYYNAFANCDPDDNESKEYVFAELLKLAQAKVSPLGNYAEIRPMLRARLRLLSQLELFAMQCELKGDEPVDIPYRVIATEPSLVAELCIDRGETIAMVTEHHLRAWGRSFASLLDEVVAALETASTPGKWRRMPDDQGCWLAQYRDGFDASRILCPSLVRALKPAGGAVVMAPHNEVLLVASAASPRSIRAMFDVVVSLFDKVPEPVVGMWSLDSAGAWTPWSPPESEPALCKMHRSLSARGLGQQYHSQKKLLDKLHEKRELKTMVPSATLMQHPTSGDVLSHCIWQMGMDNLLPFADIVMFCTPENLARPIIGQAKFAALMHEMGAAVVMQNTSPPRWLCPKGVFPSPEQIVQLSGSDFEAPEVKDAGKRLQEMIAEAHRQREKEELQEKLL